MQRSAKGQRLADPSVSVFSAVLEAGRSFSALLSLSALDSLWEEAVSSLLDSLADSALDSLLDSDALDAELEECSELPEALSAVLWEELDEDAGFSSELPELLDVLPELAPEEELLDALEWDELLEAASPLTVSVRVLLLTLQSL